MSASEVTPVSALQPQPLRDLLHKYQLQLEVIAEDQEIPGSFWGGSEAGLIGKHLIVRPDTPAHSLLHEACHYICMSPDRRQALHTNAGGDYAEENAVCYLQILLAEQLPPLNSTRLMADMDAWGYSFRLGSSRAWFERDAEDARAWLLHHGLLGIDGTPTGKLRTD